MSDNNRPPLSRAVREKIAEANSNPLQAFGLAIACLEKCMMTDDAKYKAIKRMIEDWCAGKPSHIGVMAQEVEKTNPEAVSRDPESGYRLVDCGMLLGLPRNPNA